MTSEEALKALDEINTKSIADNKPYHDERLKALQNWTRSLERERTESVKKEKGKQDEQEIINSKYIVTFRAFIPDRFVPNIPPHNKITNLYHFKGDDRYYYHVDNPNFRTEQKVKINFETKTHELLSNVANATHGYDKNKKLIESSQADENGAGSIKVSTVEDSVTIEFYIDASNKLVAGAPAINARITLKIEPYIENNAIHYKYSIKGNCDGFPAYDMFVTDVDKSESNLVFNQNPIDANSQTVLSLFGTGDGEFSYDFKGDSQINKNTKKGDVIMFRDINNSKEN